MQYKKKESICNPVKRKSRLSRMLEMDMKEQKEFNKNRWKNKLLRIAMGKDK